MASSKTAITESNGSPPTGHESKSLKDVVICKEANTDTDDSEDLSSFLISAKISSPTSTLSGKKRGQGHDTPYTIGGVDEHKESSRPVKRPRLAESVEVASDPIKPEEEYELWEELEELPAFLVDNESPGRDLGGLCDDSLDSLEFLARSYAPSEFSDTDFEYQESELSIATHDSGYEE